MTDLFDKLDSIPYEEPDDMDKAMIKKAEFHKDEDTVDFEDVKNKYAEKFILRIPKSLGLN